MGNYQYGDMTLTFPLINEQLETDATHLLELRDTLAGAGSLNWSTGRDISTWTGVTLEGSPLRVTKLELSDLGLSGELSGLLGNLTALTTLRLDGNDLTGGIPSKLTQLPRLRHLHLRDNPIGSCVPPPLRGLPNTDIDSLGLPDCGSPIDITYDDRTLTQGTYQFAVRDDEPFLLFDVPAGVELSLGGLILGGGMALVLDSADGASLGLNVDPCQSWGRWPDDVDRALGAGFDRIEESRWLREHVWPPPPELTVLRVAAQDVLVLGWTDEPALAASWQHRWRASSGPETRPWGAWTDIPGSDVTTRRYRVRGLTPDREYEFQIRRHGATGDTPSNSAFGTRYSLPRDGIPNISDGEVVIGDGFTQWRLLDSDYLVTLPARVRVAVHEYAENQVIVLRGDATRYVSFDLSTGQLLSWTVDSFSEGIIASIRVVPADN